MMNLPPPDLFFEEGGIVAPPGCTHVELGTARYALLTVPKFLMSMSNEEAEALGRKIAEHLRRHGLV